MEPSERRVNWVGFGGQWLHRVWTKGLSHTLNACVELRWDHKLLDREEHIGEDWRTRGWDEGRGVLWGQWRREWQKKEGVVFAFRVLLTQSDSSSRQGNLCGQCTPWGSDMCSCWEHGVQVKKCMKNKKTNGNAQVALCLHLLGEMSFLPYIVFLMLWAAWFYFLLL